MGITKLSMSNQFLAAYLITDKLKDELTNCCVRLVDNVIQSCAHSQSTAPHTSTRQGSQQV